MFYGLAFLFSLGLLVFCVLDCLAADSSQVRILPKAFWLALIIFVPTMGSVGWLLLGRPEKSGLLPRDARARMNPPASRPKRPLGPDDDPRFQEMTRNLMPPRTPAPEPVNNADLPAPADGPPEPPASAGQ